MLLCGPNRHAHRCRRIAELGLDLDIETLHLDKGFDSAGVRDTIAKYGITDVIITKRRKRGDPKPAPVPANTAGHTLGQR